MASVAIVLNTTYKLGNGQYAVAIRVTHERKQKYISLNALVNFPNLYFKCSSEHWIPARAEDNGLGKFRKTFTTFKECNAILLSKLNEAQAILKRYEEIGIAFTFDMFEADLKRKEYLPKQIAEPLQQAISIQQYYSDQIVILDEQGRVGLSGLYLENQRILKKFRPDALLSDINFRFLESFEYWIGYSAENDQVFRNKQVDHSGAN